MVREGKITVNLINYSVHYVATDASVTSMFMNESSFMTSIQPTPVNPRYLILKTLLVGYRMLKSAVEVR